MSITATFTSGIAGQRGTKWYTGAGAPTTVAGSLEADMYLDTNTGDVYQLLSGTWTFTLSISGSGAVTYPGPYADDAAAAADGVAIGKQYTLALPNAYGLPDGVIKQRTV